MFTFRRRATEPVHLGPSKDEWVDAEYEANVISVFGNEAVDDDTTLRQRIQRGKVKIPLGGVMIADDPGELGVNRYGTSKTLTDEEAMRVAMEGVLIVEEVYPRNDRFESF